MNKWFSVFLLIFANSTPTFSNQYIFTENKGQRPDNVYFESVIQGGKMFYEANSWKILQGKFIPEEEGDNCGNHYCDDGHHHPLANHFHAVEIKFKNANEVIPIPQKSSNYYSNYFLGNNPDNWGQRAYSFQEIDYKNLYACIDLHAEEENGNLKYDFKVGAGTNPSIIALEIEGANELRLNEKGELEIETSVTTIIDRAPYAFQIINGEKQTVACEYVLKNNLVSFAFPSGYNTNYELIIDPELVFSTYSGSNASNWGWTATYDAEENSIGGGVVGGGGYPLTTGVLDASFNGGMWDMGITKFTADGTDLIYSTYIGGSGDDHPHSMITNSQGQLVILGSTSSSNFPTQNAYDSSYGGGAYDIALIVLSADGGDLIGSTFFGGSQSDGYNNGNLYHNYGDEGRGEVILDADDNIYIGSITSSSNLATIGVFQENKATASDGILAKFSPNLSSLEWASYFGGSAADGIFGIKINSLGEIIVAGGTRSSNLPTTPSAFQQNFQGFNDGFLAYFSSDASSLEASTYMGTPQYDQTFFVEIDGEDNIYTFGQTTGNYFTTPGAYVDQQLYSPQFIHKFTPDLSSTIWASKIGASIDLTDFTIDTTNLSPTALNVDICNRVYISGWSSKEGYRLPTTSDALQEISNDGLDFYVMVMEPDGNAIKYGTFFGQNNSYDSDAGNTLDDHVDGGTSRFSPNGYIHQAVCSGGINSTSFPTTPNAYEDTNGTGSGYNLAVFKMFLDPQILIAKLDFDAVQASCALLDVDFTNNSNTFGSEVQYFWDFGDGDTSEEENPIHAFPAPGIYEIELIVVDSTSCNISDTLKSTVNVIQEFEIPETSFTAAPNGACGTTIYDFTNSSVLKEDISNYEFLWDFGNGNTDTNPNSSFNFDDFGMYDVSLTVSSSTLQCVQDSTYTLSLDIQAPYNFASNIDLPNTVCANEIFSLFTNNTNGTPDTYAWNLGDTNTSTDAAFDYAYSSEGNYTITVDLFDLESCVQTQNLSHNIVVEGVKEDIIAHFDFVVPADCSSFEVPFTNNTALAEAQSNYNFLWDFGDGNTSTEFSPTHEYATQGDYTINLTISSDDDCKTIQNFSDNLSFSFDNTVADFTIDSEACAPYQLATQALQTAQTYTWNFNGEISNNSELNMVLDNAGIYNLQLVVADTTTCNKTDTLNRSIAIYSQANAEFTASALTAKENDTLSFEAINLLSDIDYVFTIDGVEIDSLDFEYSFDNIGTYEVCLKGSSGLSACDVESCKTITIDAEFFVEAPTAFSPNGDSVNDEFKIIWTGVEEMELNIYNRFGKRVFYTQDKEAGWDGKYKDELQEVGVYLYYARGISRNGTIFEEQGNISLIL